MLYKHVVIEHHRQNGN